MPQRPDPSRTPHCYTRGYLPHHDVSGLCQLLTFRQDDSIPARLAWAYDRVVAKATTPAEVERARDRVFAHSERYLGHGRGTCRLRDPRAVESTLHFHRRDYELIAWVVMPNHVHVIVRPTGATLALITRRWKSWTARQINGIFGTTGRFWQPEVFDRRIRGLEDQDTAIRYVELNPVHAGLCRNPIDWPFSSARLRPERWGGSGEVDGFG